MHLMLALLFSLAAWAEPTQYTFVTTPVELTLYRKPDAGSKVLLIIAPGEQIQAGPMNNGFRRVRIRQHGKWRAGYVSEEEFTRSPEQKRSILGGWGLGGGAMMTALSQGSRGFATQDLVDYTVSELNSQTVSYFVAAQFGRRHFWRLTLANRIVEFKGTATTDVSNTPREMRLEHEMVATAVQKVWMPFATDIMYLGAGLEMAFANTTKLVLGGSEVPTSKENNPYYFGMHAIVGTQVPIGRRVTVYGEARPMLIPHQSPMMMGFELAGGLLFWP